MVRNEIRQIRYIDFSRLRSSPQKNLDRFYRAKPIWSRGRTLIRIRLSFVVAANAAQVYETRAAIFVSCSFFTVLTVNRLTKIMHDGNDILFLPKRIDIIYCKKIV